MKWRRKFPGRATATSGMRRRRVAGDMNKTEARYAREVLDLLVERGDVLKYWFEEWTFKLGPDLRYTPDFVVLFADGSLEVREVKARDKRTGKYRAEDDARVKMKVFADTMPLAMGVVWPGPRGSEQSWELTILSPSIDGAT